MSTCNIINDLKIDNNTNKISTPLCFIHQKKKKKKTLTKYFLFTAEETRAYRKLKKIIRTPTEIIEVFKTLIFSDDNVQQLIDGSTNTLVSTSSILFKKASQFAPCM
jgi:hypothetical protein